MAIRSGFFNSANGDRKYDAGFFSQYFATFIGNGIFPNPSTSMQIIANDDMSVTLKAGKAWINGYVAFNDVDMVLPIEIADGVLKRIDRIVLQHSTADRAIDVKVRKGVFASTPVAPVLQRDADAYELALADVYVNNGAISITQANVTDLRLNSNLCGIVHGVVDQVDTETLFLQFQQWYLETTEEAELSIEQIKSDYQDNFDTWFTSVQDILDGNTAGSLLLLINQNADDIIVNSDKITNDVITSAWIGSERPYIQEVANSNVTATNAVEVSLASSATEAETIAFDDLNLKDGGQTTGAFTLKCWGIPNLISVPIIINVRGV